MTAEEEREDGSFSFRFPAISNHCTKTLIVIELTSRYFLEKIIVYDE